MWGKVKTGGNFSDIMHRCNRNGKSSQLVKPLRQQLFQCSAHFGNIHQMLPDPDAGLIVIICFGVAVPV